MNICYNTNMIRNKVLLTCLIIASYASATGQNDETLLSTGSGSLIQGDQKDLSLLNLFLLNCSTDGLGFLAKNELCGKPLDAMNAEATTELSELIKKNLKSFWECVVAHPESLPDVVGLIGLKNFVGCMDSDHAINALGIIGKKDLEPICEVFCNLAKLWSYSELASFFTTEHTLRKILSIFWTCVGYTDDPEHLTQAVTKIGWPKFASYAQKELLVKAYRLPVASRRPEFFWNIFSKVAREIGWYKFLCSDYYNASNGAVDSLGFLALCCRMSPRVFVLAAEAIRDEAGPEALNEFLINCCVPEKCELPTGCDFRENSFVQEDCPVRIGSMCLLSLFFAHADPEEIDTIVEMICGSYERLLKDPSYSSVVRHAGWNLRKHIKEKVGGEERFCELLDGIWIPKLLGVDEKPIEAIKKAGWRRVIEVLDPSDVDFVIKTEGLTEFMKHKRTKVGLLTLTEKQPSAILEILEEFARTKFTTMPSDVPEGIREQIFDYSPGNFRGFGWMSFLCTKTRWQVLAECNKPELLEDAIKTGGLLECTEVDGAKEALLTLVKTQTTVFLSSLEKAGLLEAFLNTKVGKEVFFESGNIKFLENLSKYLDQKWY